MEQFLSFIIMLLGIIGAISTLWLIATPVGIILAILKKLNKVKYSWKFILILGFGGVFGFIGSFVLFFLVSLIAGFFGIPIEEITLPS